MKQKKITICLFVFVRQYGSSTSMKSKLTNCSIPIEWSGIGSI